jgi:hypothetical protein
LAALDPHQSVRLLESSHSTKQLNQRPRRVPLR